MRFWSSTSPVMVGPLGLRWRSIEEYSHVVQSLITTSGLGSATLIGHSMGSLIGLELGNTEQVDVLVLTGAASEMPVHPELLSAAEATDPKAFELVTAWSFGKPAHLGGHPGAGVWMTGGGHRLLQRSPVGVLGTDLTACNQYDHGKAAAAAVSVPTLILSGSKDRMTPPKANRALADIVPNAQLDVIEGAGHMMMLESPNETLAAFRRFIED